MTKPMKQTESEQATPRRDADHTRYDHDAVTKVWEALGTPDYDGRHISEHVAHLRESNKRLREALGDLVRACTPPRTVGDSRIYGVRMPEKEIVEAARAALKEAE